MRKREGPFSGWLVLALLVAGAASAGWGWVEQRKAEAFLRTAVRVQGEVVRLEEAEGTLRPIVRYKTEGGRTVEIEGSGYGPQYVEEQRVVVAYPPGEPDKGQIVGLSDVYRKASIYWALGGVTVFVSFVLMVVLWRAKINRPPAWARGR